MGVILSAALMTSMLGAGINLGPNGLAYFSSSPLISKSLVKPKNLGFGVSATLGYLATRSSVNTTSLNAEVRLGYNTPTWEHRLELQAISASTDGQTTAQQYYLAEQSSHLLTRRSYVFGFAGYLHARFSGYRYQASEVGGYGIRWVNTNTQLLRTEVGLGMSQARTSGTTIPEESKSGPAGRFRLLYRWQFSKDGAFHQSATVERSSFNTYIELHSKITAQLFNNIALSVGYTLQRNSSVPAGIPNTTSYTSVAVQYTFGSIFSN